MRARGGQQKTGTRRLWRCRVFSRAPAPYCEMAGKLWALVRGIARGGAWWLTEALEPPVFWRRWWLW